MKIDYKSIKRELEKQRCREHNQCPKISVTGSTFKYEVCCEAFKQQLIRKNKELYEKEVAKGVKKDLGNLFR